MKLNRENELMNNRDQRWIKEEKVVKINSEKREASSF